MYHEPHEDNPPEAMGHRFRRGRRHTPAGVPAPRARLRNRFRPPCDWKSVQIGDVVADLTPRQAVVWLLNFETMVSLYESTTGQALDEEARGRLVQSLRSIVGERRR